MVSGKQGTRIKEERNVALQSFLKPLPANACVGEAVTNSDDQQRWVALSCSSSLFCFYVCDCLPIFGHFVLLCVCMGRAVVEHVQRTLSFSFFCVVAKGSHGERTKGARHFVGED